MPLRLCAALMRGEPDQPEAEELEGLNAAMKRVESFVEAAEQTAQCFKSMPPPPQVTSRRSFSRRNTSSARIGKPTTGFSVTTSNAGLSANSQACRKPTRTLS